MEEEIKRIVGTVSWFTRLSDAGFNGEYWGSAIVTRGILRDGELKIDIAGNNDMIGGLVRLTSKDGLNYIGHFTPNSSDGIPAEVKIRYYEALNTVAVIGTWIEKKAETYQFVGELNRVEKFDN